MRKTCLIGLCVFALCGRANATVSGFESAVAPSLGITVDNTFCNRCVAYLACGAWYGYDVMERAACGIDSFGAKEEFLEAAQTYCRSYAQTAYEVLEAHVQYAFTTAFVAGAETYEGVYCVGALDELSQRRSIAYNVIQTCHQIGACMCGTGKFVQPRGIETLNWGTNSQCVQCPSGGTSDDNGGNVYITSCYIPSGGSFSDETGSGTVTGKCSYTLDGDIDPGESIN